MSAATLAFARRDWKRNFATQACTIRQPGATETGDYGFGEVAGERTLVTTCRVIGPLSQPREVTEGDRVVGLADFEVRLPWDVSRLLTVRQSATIEVIEGAGDLVGLYRVVGVDRGRPDAWYIGCFCVREERTVGITT